MQCLVKLYDKALQWSQHPHASRYLAGVSFVEASVFPIPPYFMLGPMALAKPDKALRYAFIATIASVLGGTIGYLLGMLLFNPLVLPVLEYFHYVDKYNQVVAQLQTQGFWAVLIAGFTPLPFKLVAIGSGVMRVPLVAFLFGSLFGRATKFYLLALLIKLGGANMEQKIRLAIEKLGLVFLILAAGVAVFALTGCTTQQDPARVVRATPTINRIVTKYTKSDPAKDKMTRSVNNVKSGSWAWPTQGSILTSFASSKKGIDISGKDGAPVVAANDGEVVYSGNSLRGYGNLIIVKHDKNYLTAYAHNRKNLVKEGDKVRKGQRIAEMGRTGAETVKLHFEVRNQGKPVDPMTVLPRR